MCGSDEQLSRPFDDRQRGPVGDGQPTEKGDASSPSKRQTGGCAGAAGKQSDVNGALVASDQARRNLLN